VESLLSDTDYLNLKGIDRDSFDDLCGHVKEVRETKVRSIRTCIGILLTKLRSGMSNALLSTMFNMSVAATQRSISTARNALTKLPSWFLPMACFYGGCNISVENETVKFSEYKSMCRPER
jgi:hypothetical protein